MITNGTDRIDYIRGKKRKFYPAPLDVGSPPDSVAEWARKVIASWNLTPAESQCLDCLLKGLSDKEIAKALGNSEKTIKHHLTTVRRKSHCESRAQIFAEILRL